MLEPGFPSASGTPLNSDPYVPGSTQGVPTPNQAFIDEWREVEKVLLQSTFDEVRVDCQPKWGCSIVIILEGTCSKRKIV